MVRRGAVRVLSPLGARTQLRDLADLPVHLTELLIEKADHFREGAGEKVQLQMDQC